MVGTSIRTSGRSLSSVLQMPAPLLGTWYLVPGYDLVLLPTGSYKVTRVLVCIFRSSGQITVVVLMYVCMLEQTDKQTIQSTISKFQDAGRWQWDSRSSLRIRVEFVSTAYEHTKNT